MTTENNQQRIFEFDSFPGKVGTVEIREDDEETRLVLNLGGEEETLLKACRDQWGVFLFTDGNCVAQEDQTRSFLHALLMGITRLRDLTEFETADSTAISKESNP